MTAPWLAESSGGRCPRCDDAYLEHTYLGAVAVDRCPACMGHWFRRGDLAELLKSPTLSYVASHFGGMGLPAVRVTAPPECPRCAIGLKRARPAQLNQAAVDVCPRCGGTWLDGVELQRVLAKQARGKDPLSWLLETIEFVLTSGRKPR